MDRPPARTLLEVLIRQSRHTIEENCAAFGRAAKQLGERASLSPRQLSRWMAGEVDSARPVMQRVAEYRWGYAFSELLGPSVTQLNRPVRGLIEEKGTANAPDGTDWPVWFGMHVAHAVSMVHNWTGDESAALQTLLHQEILMLDASAPFGGQSVFETSRRQALITLATLRLTVGAARGSGESIAATEYFLGPP